MSAERLLVVAPETDLRRSLVFALETEGYAVATRDEPPLRSWLVANRFDCTIIDQKALNGPPYESIALCIKAHPVVLLAASPHEWLVEWVEVVVDLPLSGSEVSAAIRRAMHIEA